MTKIKKTWQKLPSWVKAAVHTGWAVMIATAIPPVLGWLDEVRIWANSFSWVAFPSFDWSHVLAGAVTAGISAAVTAVFRRAKPPEGSYPGGDPAP